MSDAQFATVLGTVQQFPDKDVVTEREVSGQTVREFTIRSAKDGKLVRLTLWPEFNEVDIEKGLFVAADGPVQVNEVKGNTYYNMNVRTLSVGILIGREEREVENKKGKRTKKEPTF